MLPTNFRSSLYPLFTAGALVLFGCRAGGPEVPDRLAVDPNPPPGFSWLACPGGDPTGTVREVIGRDGGTLTHPSGHVLTVPAGAVDRDRNFVLHEPASEHMAVIATAAGNPTFSVPVSLTISYARCAEPIDPTRLQVFRVNPGGNHDSLGGTPADQNSFRTDQLSRLSAYALAIN